MMRTGGQVEENYLMQKLLFRASSTRRWIK